jgi:hypothetical protein
MIRSIFVLLLVLPPFGCPHRGDDADAPTASPAGKSLPPDVQLLLDKYNALDAQNRQLMQREADRITRVQTLQKSVKRWLYVSSIALGALAVLGLLGRLVSGVPSWWGAVLAWIGGKVAWREIVLAAAVAPACFALAWYLDDIWWYAWAAVKVLAVLALMFVSWQFACRHYTGKWDYIGDGITPRRR